MKSMRSPEKGFSLVEMAIVLTIVGVMVGGALSALGPYLDLQNYETTQEKMEKIADAMTVYAQNFYRLPCPADPTMPTGAGEPFGTPKNSGSAGILLQTCSAIGFNVADQIGIVPFKVLGLTENDVKDGYGNFITYKVASQATGRNMANVHEQCRTPIWINGTNRNPRKAGFCCASFQPGDQLLILLNPAGNQMAETGYDGITGMASPDTPALSATPAIGNEFLAFVLISHGKNGFGAFVKGTGGKRAGTLTAQETSNGTNVMTNMLAPYSTIAGADYFDDILLWRTNVGVISEFGNQTCSRP